MVDQGFVFLGLHFLPALEIKNFSSCSVLKPKCLGLGRGLIELVFGKS